MTSRIRRALGLALAAASLFPAAAATAATDAPGKPTFDSRTREPIRPVVPSDPAAIRGRDRLSAQLGRQGVLDLDDRTGTPRTVARLDGFLTGPSGDDPAQVVLDYVRAQRDVFGLSDDNLAALRLARRYTDRHGVTHLLWAQTWRGIAAWDNSLRAAVAADGRLISVGGSPVPGLASRTADPGLTASEALSEALGDAGRRGLAPRPTSRAGADQRTTFTGGHDARLVLFTERAGDVHLAWKVTDHARPAEIYDHLIDAHSGAVLFRDNRVNAIDAQVHAFEYTPAEGTQAARTVPVTDDTRLRGPNAHVFANVDSNGVIEEFPANVGGPSPIWNDPFTDKCGTGFCSWDGTADSWQDNLPQAAQQGYYFADTFHDWLLAEVGFTDATGGFGSADLLSVEVFTGADDGNDGLPSNRNNAFAAPDPDGQGAFLSFFLFDGGRDSVNDATVFYHEYGHALSNRLVIRSSGASALGTTQSNSMGEGWSDWYALDYLVANNLETDTGTPGELAVGAYAANDPQGVRSDNLDCPVGHNSANCPTNKDTFGEISGFSVHSDGQVWAQTLWDLRTALGGNGAGAQKARQMITEAMRLSPDDPSFIDMRNSILLADQALNGGANRGTIWQVFAARGMGFLATTETGEDPSPDQDFTAGPPSGGGVTVTGRVTDANTGAPVAGALVRFAQLPGDQTGVTDANGNYSIGGLAATSYPRILITAPGYELLIRSATVGSGGGRMDQSLRRNFAATAGGATVTGFDGPDFSSFGCGPQHALDGSQQTGWGSRAQNHPVSPGEKAITIALPQTTDVGAFRIDPGAVCGDDDTASTGDFRVETSTDGSSFSEAASGRFASSDNHVMNEIQVNRTGVRFVRFVMEAPQSQAAGTSGEDFLDVTEFEALPPPPPPPAATPPAGGGSTSTTGSGLGVEIDRVAPRATLRLVARQKLRTALAKGMKITVDCNEPCSGRFTARLDARTAKRLKLLPRRSRAKSVRVAAGSLRMGQGRRTATLKFTAKAKRALKRERTVKLATTGTLTDRSGNSATRATRFTLRR